MRKLFFILLCFVSKFIFSQGYHFDYFIKINNERLEEERRKWKFEKLFNSENGFEVFFKVNEKKILAVLNDKKKNIRHVFRVNKVGEKYDFFYKHSIRLNRPSEKYINFNKENVIIARKIDSLNYKIFVYNDSSLKKINKEVIITLAESDFNYLEINADYNRSEDMKEELKKKLPSNSKFVIATIKYLNAQEKVYYKTSYEDISKIDFFLTVPDKIMFKETDYWSDFEE